MTAYTERQIEIANLMQGVDPEVVDEIVASVEREQREGKEETMKEDTELLIKLQILHETDWRKRAALSALLISKSLE